MPTCVAKSHANMQTSTIQPYMQVQFFFAMSISIYYNDVCNTKCVDQIAWLSLSLAK